MNFTLRFTFSVIGLFVALNTYAQDLTVSTQQLGALSQKTAPIEAISYYSGQDLRAQVKALPGQSNSIRSPMVVRRTVFLKPNGSAIDKGEAFVTLSGPEVHHYYSEYLLKEALFTQNKVLYDNSKTLFSKKALSEQAWLQISKEYIASKLEFDEFTHFFDLMQSFEETTDTLILKSPVSGILIYQHFDNLSAEQQIASIVPLKSIRLVANFPLNQAQLPTHITHDGCRLAVAFVEKVATGYLSQLWSEPLQESCPLSYHEMLSVIPEFAFSGFLVDKSSLFTLDGSHYIFIKKGDTYKAVEVELISSLQNQYVVSSQIPLAEEMTLITSVSAAQGILMGIGE